MFLNTVHWPSWLRGFGMAIVGYGLVNRDIIYGLIGMVLYALSLYLYRYAPYIRSSRRT